MSKHGSKITTELTTPAFYSHPEEIARALNHNHATTL